MNALLARMVDGLLRPFQAWPLAGLAVASLISAIGILLIVRATSDQARLAIVKRALHACVFEVRLFNDDVRAMLRAVREMLGHNLTYLRLSMVPLLWTMVPVGLLLGQLHAHYGYGGLAVGHQAVVKARLKDASPSHRPQVRIDAPPGLRIETPPVWMPAIREVAWRLGADAPGDYEIRLHVGEDVFTKSVRVSDLAVRRSPVRTDATLFNQLLHPAEPPLPAGSEVESIAITYPERGVKVLGWEVHWMVVFFALSLFFVFALRAQFKVVL